MRPTSGFYEGTKHYDLDHCDFDVLVGRYSLWAMNYVVWSNREMLMLHEEDQGDWMNFRPAGMS